MNSTNAPTRSPSAAVPGKRPLARTTAITVAMLLGATTLIATVSPTARAVALGSSNTQGNSLMSLMHGGADGHADLHAHFDTVLARAGVDEAHRARIHGIARDALVSQRADLQRFHENAAELKALLTASTLDDAAIARVRAEQDRLALAASHRLSDTLVAVARILTPTQRAKLGTDIETMMAAHGVHHHHG